VYPSYSEMDTISPNITVVQHGKKIVIYDNKLILDLICEEYFLLLLTYVLFTKIIVQLLKLSSFHLQFLI